MVLSVQPEVHKEEWRVGGICLLQGGHGRADVIDLTGLMSPKERDSNRWIETEISRGRVALMDRKIKREHYRQATDR